MKRISHISLTLVLMFVANTSNAESVEPQETAKKIALIESQLAELKDKLSKQTVITSANDEVASSQKLSNKNWQIKSYGSMLYKSHQVFKNTQDTHPQRRGFADLERVVLEFKYQFEPQWSMELELEYEHGGTGAALEYDGFEEFGEFETEIEAGGEVLVEKLAFNYAINPMFALEFGRISVPVGIGTDLHKGDQYFTTERYWSESTLIPQVWHETGVNFQADWQGFHGQALITTGLNSEYFRTYKWVATGHQKRFEHVNADDLALTLRLDYGDIKSGNSLGVSYYRGNTSGNRNKTNKVESDGLLTIVGVHGTYRTQNWSVKGQYLYGELQDSLAITQANKTTPGLQPGNFSQLGSEAESALIELAYNSQPLLSLNNPLFIFGTYQYANPIKKVQQGNPTERFDRQELSFGLNYFPTEKLVLKAQVSQQDYAQATLANTTSFSLALGYQFSI